jgi:hypothetical protein
LAIVPFRTVVPLLSSSRTGSGILPPLPSPFRRMATRPSYL